MIWRERGVYLCGSMASRNKLNVIWPAQLLRGPTTRELGRLTNLIRNDRHNPRNTLLAAR
jgi:hypothetical protein